MMLTGRYPESGDEFLIQSLNQGGSGTGPEIVQGKDNAKQEAKHAGQDAAQYDHEGFNTTPEILREGKIWISLSWPISLTG